MWVTQLNRNLDSRQKAPAARAAQRVSSIEETGGVICPKKGQEELRNEMAGGPLFS